MDNHFLLTDDLLWDYADGFLSPAEKQQVEAYLQQHPEWQPKMQAVLAEKKSFSQLPLSKPHPGFADRVMAAWAMEHVGKKATSAGQDWIIRAIVIVFGLFVLTPLIAMVVIGLQTALPAVSLPVELPSAPDINWSKILGHPALYYSVMLGMTYLVLRLLEKYLQQKGILGKVV